MHSSHASQVVALCLAVGGCAADIHEIVLSDPQNYLYEIRADGTTQTVASGRDTQVDWGDLDEDLLGDVVDPVEAVEAVNVVHFDIPQTDVLEGIACGTLEQADVVAFVSVEVRDEQVSAAMSEFSLQGTPVDPEVDIVEDPGGSYLVSASSTGGDGVVSYYGYAFFAPSVGAPDANVLLDPTTSSLEVTVDLASVDPIQMPDGRLPVIDWSALDTGSCGAIDLSNIDTLSIQRFDIGLEELQDDFVHADALASATWLQREGVAGYGDFDLDDLDENGQGESFDGIDADHTWLLAFSCSTCLSPAPPFVGVLTPAP